MRLAAKVEMLVDPLVFNRRPQERASLKATRRATISARRTRLRLDETRSVEIASDILRLCELAGGLRTDDGYGLSGRSLRQRGRYC